MKPLTQIILCTFPFFIGPDTLVVVLQLLKTEVFIVLLLFVSLPDCDAIAVFPFLIFSTLNVSLRLLWKGQQIKEFIHTALICRHMKRITMNI